MKFKFRTLETLYPQNGHTLRDCVRSLRSWYPNAFSAKLCRISEEIDLSFMLVGQTHRAIVMGKNSVSLNFYKRVE